ncbi:MAG: YARHG domain-containing protein [Bacillus sp. (in: firmicutes)]
MSNMESATRTQPSKKMPYIIIAIVVILIVALFTGYQLLAKKYSEEVVVDQFITALNQKDKTQLKQVIVPSDTRIKVNDESLDALFALLDEQPSLTKDIETSLNNESLGNQPFFVNTNGKHFGIFDRYVIDTTGYYLSVSSTEENTKIFLGNSEIGVIEEADGTKEFGPYLAGTYTVKGVGSSVEDIVTIDLMGTQTKTEVSLDTGGSEEEEEVTTIIREIVREVPAGSSYYILPDSDYRYLTYSDIAGLSKAELRIARNEIYARHGYIFKSEDLQDYFSSQAWYSPDPNYTDNLSAVEKANVEFIKEYE